jgi:hypothetical protein
MKKVEEEKGKEKKKENMEIVETRTLRQSFDFWRS